MVWQVVVPGTHTVTVVNSVLTSGLVLVGPASTMTLTTLLGGGVVPPVEPPDEVELPLPLAPPPQESTGRHRAAHSPKRHARAAPTVRAHLTIHVIAAISVDLQR